MMRLVSEQILVPPPELLFGLNDRFRGEAGGDAPGFPRKEICYRFMSL